MRSIEMQTNEKRSAGFCKAVDYLDNARSQEIGQISRSLHLRIIVP